MYVSCSVLQCYACVVLQCYTPVVLQCYAPVVLQCSAHVVLHAIMCAAMLVQALEKERDMAEDRLKIEQTQRDSIEKLRQRNKELEEQLRELCESQVCLGSYVNH